jgi:transcriptional regulator with XRE-family HTH domain
MAPRVTRIATAFELARFGHIAAFLRGEMASRGWSRGDLNHAMGEGRSSNAPYKWLNGTGAPGPDARAKLAKVFNVPEEQFKAKPLHSDELGVADEDESVDRLPRRLVTVNGGQPGHPRFPTRQTPLVFSIQIDGTARLEVDVTLPLARATPLLRMLLDAGLTLVPTQEPVEGEHDG